MMKSEIRFARPGEIPITISITLSLDEWRKVRDALRESSEPGYSSTGKIESALSDLTFKLDRFVATYEGSEEAPPS